MSFVNLLSDETVDNLSPKNICDEYKNLRKHYNSLKHNEDACKQELYEITRSNNVSKKLICDLEMENEHLEKENLCLKETIKTLKDEMVNINKKQIKSDEQVYDESILLEKDKEIHKLQNEIDAMNCVKISINTKLEEEMERIAEENLRLNNEIDTLTEYISGIKKEHLVVVHEFEETIDNLKEQISQLQNHFKCKQEELIAAEGLRKIMTEELAMQRTEIEMMKNTSSKQITKGNSLFAEVDDRRLQLQNEMRNMKQKYINMKHKLTMKNSEIRKIHIDYQYLLNKLKEQPKDMYILTELQEEAYQTKIKDLTESIHFLKAELNNSKIEVDIKTDKIPLNMGDFIYNIANASRKEFKTLEQKIVSQSADLFILKGSLIEAKKEVSKWTYEALKHKAEATAHQVELEELKTKLSIQHEKIHSSELLTVPKDNGDGMLEDASNQKSELHMTEKRSRKKTSLFEKNNRNIENKPVNIQRDINSDIDFEITSTDTSEFNSQNKSHLLFQTHSNILKISEHNSSKLLDLNIIDENGDSVEKLKLKEFERSNYDPKECKVSNYNLEENEQENVIKPKDTISKIKKVCFSEDTQEPRQTVHTKFNPKGGTIVPIKHRIFIPSKKSITIKKDSLPANT